MRRALLIGAGAAAGAFALAFTVFAGPSAKASKPSLRITRPAPLTVRGRHFHDREQVRLTAGARTAQATANGDGYFVITIPGADRCNTVRVLARGSAGSYAVVKLLPAPACMPARSGG